ncbi:MAG: type I restriction enzyme HsdR N-terminal domain-containing protein [Planctomycetota bacterium]
MQSLLAVPPATCPRRQHPPMPITKKITERIQSGLKRFLPIMNAQRDRDVSEADTVTIVKDLLSEVFGYDKYAELTSEHAIRGTYCDLAIHFDGKLQLLIEVKAIGSALQDRHVKQTIDYAANQGVEWVVLTNGIEWVLFRVIFKKPIEKEEVVHINLCEIDLRDEADLEKLYLLTRAGLSKDALTEFRDRQDATNRFLLAAILLNSDAVMSAIRREVRRTTDILVEKETIERVLRDQVIKRDALEGDQAMTATRRFNRKSDRSIHREEASGVDCAPVTGAAENTSSSAQPEPTA